MACGGPKDEFGVGFGMEVDRLVRRLEGRELARLHGFGNSKASRTERDPANAVIGRRLVAPGFATLQVLSQVAQRGVPRERTRHGAQLAEQYLWGPTAANH